MRFFSRMAAKSWVCDADVSVRSDGIVVKIPRVLWGRAQGWSNWSPDAKAFVSRFREIEPLRPPRMTDRLALELVTSIQTLYSAAYPPPVDFSAQQVVDHWRRTPTKSIRLLVRLTINELDLLTQSKSV